MFGKLVEHTPMINYDKDGQQPRSSKAQSPTQSSQQNAFQDVALMQPVQSSDSMDYMSSHDILDNQRQRRLSNSSFASDVSFRLPSYETPSMYHLQSDMEVSASEAEERGFTGSNISLDRVTKEQLYAAYRRTQERYTKYRTQYGDLARHYKLLERENAKARSVLVETQDKALRRISELREQCALEQSAKAHLEKALRIEIEEKGMKIDALNTKVQLLQSNSNISSSNENNDIKTKSNEGDGDVQLINISNDNEVAQTNQESSAAEVMVLNTKIEKMEQLLNKYKESLKLSKEKNAQVNTEIQILSNELDNKNKEIEQLKVFTDQLTEANKKIQELNNINEDLQNKINVYEFNKTKEQSTLEIDFQKAQEEITELRAKIEIFSKREEEYAISLAENKLSIHKELESKESEIKSLKEHLESSKKEIQSLNIVINDYKNNVTLLEGERSKLSHDSSELSTAKLKIVDLESQLAELSTKCQNLEQVKAKADEGYKCLQLQLKQENAEKLAMIDRNTYLENRNTQLSDENSKKSSQIGHLESELQKKDKILKDKAVEETKKDELSDELITWKDKYAKLESEIQEERDELIKLQSEIEKLLTNHELLQTQNFEFRRVVSELKSENAIMHEKVVRYTKIKSNCIKLSNEVREMKKLIHLVSSEAKSLQTINNEAFFSLTKEINYALNNISYSESNVNTIKINEINLEKNKLQERLKTTTEQHQAITSELQVIKDENNNLKSTINALKLEKNSTDEELINITKRYEVVVNDLNIIKEENENLLHKINEYENNFQNLQIAMDFEKTQNSNYNEKLNLIENENQTLLEKLKCIESETSISNKELDTFKDLHNKTLEELNAIKKKNEDLLDQVEELEKNTANIIRLQEDNKTLTLENIELKSRAENIDDSYQKLEIEINDLRRSHADIEREKDHLNEVIEKLEASSCKKIQNNESQTDVIIEQTASEQNIHQLTSDNEYKQLKTDYDILKEENRRLKSDIEGLQTYLTKISKENSVLNDKLRELIATSEHSTDNSDMSMEFAELNKEVQLRKEKIDDLIRENMLLVEENLELKDQIQSQNYPTPDINDNGNENFRDKYNNLLQVNSALEKRLSDFEQMNKSVDGNMLQIQEKNEKLKLTNEKLEMRLDEALVSLRHLHSLQENTELEYLRNILYEYLTGSGTHSVTLAKVLSAIVKFDDMQTKQVLQKEKERQGFLRQLGII
uniref:GRIP domain-containing protein n=1 Tax=Heliothis virescens TaxID=7102 RepID=A0A2A4JXT3_HELVI